jgi:hypothetical protein
VDNNRQPDVYTPEDIKKWRVVLKNWEPGRHRPGRLDFAPPREAIEKFCTTIENAWRDCAMWKTAFNHRDKLLNEYDEKAVQVQWCQINASAADIATKRYENLAVAFDKLTDVTEHLLQERDEARTHARVLAHAYEHDARPPADVVKAALAHPVPSGYGTLGAKGG